jgi:hypothetical protein
VRCHHPNATIWMSPAGETAAWMDAWYAALATPAVKHWLTGVSHGPVILTSETQVSRVERAAIDHRSTFSRMDPKCKQVKA